MQMAGHCLAIFVLVQRTGTVSTPSRFFAHRMIAAIMSPISRQDFERAQGHDLKTGSSKPSRNLPRAGRGID